jgi:hypothetical protein
MTATLRVPRSRGALSGLLLVLLGIWGALIPFVGPYFHYAYTPDRTWDYTTGRLWLEVLPGLAAVAGGLLMLGSRLRPVAVFGTWLAAAGGAWFAVGGLAARHWTTIPGAGSPVGGTGRVVLEQFGFFIGLGVVIVFVAGAAMGRLSLVAARDVAAATVPETEPETVPAGSVPVRSGPGRFLRSRSAAPAEAEETTASSGPSVLPRRMRLSAPVVRARKTDTADTAADASQDDTESATAGSSTS